MTEKLIPHLQPLSLEAHYHEHHHHDEEPVISQRWKWMTVLGNAAIGACELITGGAGTLAVTADGLHNVGDTATYYMQSENILNPNISEKRRTRLRKIAHWAIAATSVGIGAKAGLDLALDHESTPDPLTVYTASASLALNGLMLTRLRQRRKQRTGHGHGSVHEHDLAKHFWAVDIPSAGLALAGAVLQKYNVDIEQVAAVASGAVGAYAFRPTKKNLAHNCLDHDHAPHTETHEHHHEKTNKDEEATAKKGWLEQLRYKPRHSVERQRQPSRLRRAVALGTTALALFGGLASGEAHDNKAPAEISAPAPGANTSHPSRSEKVTPPTPTEQAQITECVTIKPGDSEWKIIERRTETMIGRRPSVAATNAIAMFTALENRETAPNPNHITPDDCLKVPTLPAAQALYAAVEHSQGDNPQFVINVQTLNNQSSVEAVMHRQAEHEQITAYLQSTLTPAT